MSATLVIGSKGQLGSDLVKLLEQRNQEVVAVDLEDLDICDHEAVRNRLLDLKPNTVINTAAFHHVDDCETEVAAAFDVNVVAVHNLARNCNEIDATLMQFSTDFVFDGPADRKEPFTEEDRPSPRSVYAASRLAGEHVVRAACKKHFLVRTCGLYGLAAPAGRSTNFVETMLRLAKADKPLRVVDDQRLTPTATADLAPKLIELLATDTFGLYHVTNSGDCTWFEFARELFRLAKLTPELQSTTTQSYGAPAARPAYSVLSSSALSKIGVQPLRPWQPALADYMFARESITKAVGS